MTFSFLCTLVRAIMSEDEEKLLRFIKQYTNVYIYTIASMQLSIDNK